jgi:hypothetical protein
VIASIESKLTPSLAPTDKLKPDELMELDGVASQLPAVLGYAQGGWRPSALRQTRQTDGSHCICYDRDDVGEDVFDAVRSSPTIIFWLSQ